jgi:hypothetical protein
LSRKILGPRFLQKSALFRDALKSLGLNEEIVAVLVEKGAFIIVAHAARHRHEAAREARSKLYRNQLGPRTRCRAGRAGLASTHLSRASLE